MRGTTGIDGRICSGLLRWQTCMYSLESLNTHVAQCRVVALHRSRGDSRTRRNVRRPGVNRRTRLLGNILHGLRGTCIRELGCPLKSCLQSHQLPWRKRVGEVPSTSCSCVTGFFFFKKKKTRHMSECSATCNVTWMQGVTRLAEQQQKIEKAVCASVLVTWLTYELREWSLCSQ